MRSHTCMNRTDHRTASRSTRPNRRGDIEHNLGQGFLIRYQTLTYLESSSAAAVPPSSTHHQDLVPAQLTRALKVDQSRLCRTHSGVLQSSALIICTAAACDSRVPSSIDNLSTTPLIHQSQIRQTDSR